MLFIIVKKILFIAALLKLSQYSENLHHFFVMKISICNNSHLKLSCFPSLNVILIENDSTILKMQSFYYEILIN